MQDMPDHPVDYLCLPVGLGVEGGQFGQLGVHQRPQAGPESTDEPTLPILNNGPWQPKMNPNTLEEELSNGFCCDTIFLQGTRMAILQNW